MHTYLSDASKHVGILSGVDVVSIYIYIYFKI